MIKERLVDFAQGGFIQGVTQIDTGDFRPHDITKGLCGECHEISPEKPVFLAGLPPLIHEILRLVTNQNGTKYSSYG